MSGCATAQHAQGLRSALRRALAHRAASMVVQTVCRSSGVGGRRDPWGGGALELETEPQAATDHRQIERRACEAELLQFLIRQVGHDRSRCHYAQTQARFDPGRFRAASRGTSRRARLIAARSSKNLQPCARAASFTLVNAASACDKAASHIKSGDILTRADAECVVFEWHRRRGRIDTEPQSRSSLWR